MEPSEDFLTFAAVAFELIVPVTLVWLCFKAPKYRIHWASILGAIVPALVAAGYISVCYLFVSSEEYSFAFGAIWVMGFFAYCALLLVGVVASFFLKKWLRPIYAFITCIFIGPLFVGLVW